MPGMFVRHFVLGVSCELSVVSGQWSFEFFYRHFLFIQHRCVTPLY